jgi:hypothetical protein
MLLTLSQQGLFLLCCTLFNTAHLPLLNLPISEDAGILIRFLAIFKKLSGLRIRIILIRILIHLFSLLRIRILIKMVVICSISSLQTSICELPRPPRLCFEPLKLLNCDFDVDVDSDPIFRYNADLDPDSKK